MTGTPAISPGAIVPTCSEPGCRRPRTKLASTCSLHEIVGYQDRAWWARADVAEKIAELRSGPPPVPADDWRPAAAARAHLPRPRLLFGSEEYAWRRVRPPGRPNPPPRSPSQSPEDGLWPTEHRLAHAELKVALDHLILLLPPSHQLVVRMRFGLPGLVRFPGKTVLVDVIEEMTLEVAGIILNKSKETIRQKEIIVLDALRTLARRHKLSQHYDGEPVTENPRPAKIPKFRGISATPEFNLVTNQGPYLVGE